MWASRSYEYLICMYYKEKEGSYEYLGWSERAAIL